MLSLTFKFNVTAQTAQKKKKYTPSLDSASYNKHTFEASRWKTKYYVTK